MLVRLGLIVFIESGVFFPLLPDNSLLVTTTALRTELDIHAWQVPTIGPAAVVMGNQVDYFLGYSFGHQLFRDNVRVLRTDRPEAAEKFSAKYGPPPLMLGHLVPIVCTYIPSAAGTTNVTYGRFIDWSIIGAIGRIASMVAVGVLLSNIPEIISSIDKIMLLVIIISALPVVIGGVNARYKTVIAKRSL